MPKPKKNEKSTKKAPIKKPKEQPKEEPKPPEVVEEPKNEASGVADFLKLMIDLVDGTAKDGTANTYEPEPNNTGAPKNFMIRCPKCRWARISSGLDADMIDMHEINRGCRTCGKWRKFHCKRCGTPAAMVRIRGNS